MTPLIAPLAAEADNAAAWPYIEPSTDYDFEDSDRPCSLVGPRLSGSACVVARAVAGVLAVGVVAFLVGRGVGIRAAKRGSR